MLARPWLGDPHLALAAIACVNAWQFIGFPIVLFLVGIQSIWNSSNFLTYYKNSIVVTLASIAVIITVSVLGL